MSLNPNCCPADPFRTAEAYIMDGLGNADAEIFEGHCLICRRCLAVLEEIERYVCAIQVISRRLRAARTAGADR